MSIYQFYVYVFKGGGVESVVKILFLFMYVNITIGFGVLLI